MSARPSTFDPFRLAQARAQLALGDLAGAQLSLHALAQADAEGLIVQAEASLLSSHWQQAQRLALKALA